MANAVLPSGNGRTDMAHSVSVAFASDQAALPISGTVSVDTSALATGAKQDTGNTSVASIDTKTPAKGTAIMTGSTPVTIATDDTAINLLKQPTRTAAVTISDSTDLTSTCTKGLFVGVGGNIAIKASADSSAVTLKNVPSGVYLPGALARVMSTNTTGCTSAGDCVCYYGP